MEAVEAMTEGMEQVSEKVTGGEEQKGLADAFEFTWGGDGKTAVVKTTTYRGTITIPYTLEVEEELEAPQPKSEKKKRSRREGKRVSSLMAHVPFRLHDSVGTVDVTHYTGSLLEKQLAPADAVREAIGNEIMRARLGRKD